MDCKDDYDGKDNDDGVDIDNGEETTMAKMKGAKTTLTMKLTKSFCEGEKCP